MTKLKETNQDDLLEEGAIHMESSNEETYENNHSIASGKEESAMQVDSIDKESEANTHSLTFGVKEVAIHQNTGGEESEVNFHSSTSASVMEETAIHTEFSDDDSQATTNSSVFGIKKAAIHLESSDEEYVMTISSSTHMIEKSGLTTKFRNEDSEIIKHVPIHVKSYEEDSRMATNTSTSRMDESKQILESNRIDAKKIFDDSNCSINSSETMLEENCEKHKLSLHSSDKVEVDSEEEELDPLRVTSTPNSSPTKTKHKNTFLEPERIHIRSIKECSNSNRSYNFNSSVPIPDKDNGRDEFETSRNLPRYRFRNNGYNSVSSLDLIYGHDEAALYCNDPLTIDGDRRNQFANSRDNRESQNFRISMNPTEMKAERIEAFFYNHGIEIALGLLFLALNYVVAAHAAYQFTEAGGYTTDNDILRTTMPIARAGGRLVTLNCAVILLTGCKCMWTLVRTHIAPIFPIGFVIDGIMPRYHRYVAMTIIVSGCITHALPQIVNYASKSTKIDRNGMRMWTFGDGFATTQLLITGTLLTIIFSSFFLTTLKVFRKTAAGFRWFWFFHVGGIATAYPLLLLHGTCRGYPIFFYFALVPLALYTFDLSMRRLKISTATVIKWEIHEDEGQQITELVIERPPNFKYTPGQYAELKFLPISTREWHPFTIASAPNERGHGGDGKEKLVFYIKNCGRWTGALFNYASAFDISKATEPLQIHIRGPHGSSSMNYFEYKHILVIGSGIGVAPLLSIWKYLVAKGKSIADIKRRKSRRLKPIHQSIMNPYANSLQTERTLDSDGTDDEISYVESLQELSTLALPEIRIKCMSLQSFFESMTVSMSLFALFVLGETLTISLQIFGHAVVANSIGISLSVIALLVYGSTIIVSSIAMGWSVYSKRFKCWFECSILFVDSIALWFMLYSSFDAPEERQEDIRGDTNIYFSFFGYVIVLHAVRIFHTFYVTLKPTTTYSSKKLASHREDIGSIQGIIINRKYSSLRFAAKDLLPRIFEGGLSNFFSLKFYATQEKEMKKDDQDLISDMIGYRGNYLDAQKLLLYGDEKTHKFDNHFCIGRPNWNRIFLKAITRAHRTNNEGESVGVFFCGSPAIAKDLQMEAKRVTAQHQFAMKHLNGKACKCKLIVHSETF